jgi:hypothetical protein
VDEASAHPAAETTGISSQPRISTVEPNQTKAAVSMTTEVVVGKCAKHSNTISTNLLHAAMSSSSTQAIADLIASSQNWELQNERFAGGNSIPVTLRYNTGRRTIFQVFGESFGIAGPGGM